MAQIYCHVTCMEGRGGKVVTGINLSAILHADSVKCRVCLCCSRNDYRCDNDNIFQNCFVDFKMKLFERFPVGEFGGMV